MLYGGSGTRAGTPGDIVENAYGTRKLAGTRKRDCQQIGFINLRENVVRHGDS